MTAITAQSLDFTGVSGASVTKLLIQRLEYWFRGKKKKHFFKFLCPCDHTLYREGDSWTEELSVSRKTFLRHFDRIGTRWASKSSFDKAEDPFLGKPYACYYDRKDNITRYFKNPDVSLISFSGNTLSKSAKAEEKEAVQAQAKRKIEQKRSFIPSSLNDKSRPRKMLSPLYTRNTPDKSKDLSSMGSTTSLATTLSKEEEKIAKEIQEIWKREVGGRTYQSKTFLSKLFETFKTLFNGSLAAWKTYCRKIASSKFLMGEVSAFKAWISWAIREETYEKLQAGEYTLGDRVSEAEQQEKQVYRTQEIADILAAKTGKELEFHEEIKKRVGEGNYLAWFKDITLQLPEHANQDVLVQTTSAFAASYIKQQFLSVLEEIVNKVFPGNQICVVKSAD